MNQYLDNYIDTLSTRRQERVADLLEEAKVAKDQLDFITKKLVDLEELVPLVLIEENSEAIISSSNFDLNFRDAFIRVNELYDVSNLISTLLDSHSLVLGSEVKAIEDHLGALEKMASNYAFLLADGGAYNYGYLEPFSDERGRDVDLDFNIPDRADQAFGPAEQAIIRTEEGTLVLPDDLTASHAMSVEIIKGNATAFITSDTGVQNMLSADSATGWRMTLSSANPVTSGLPEADGAVGAQVVLEFTLTQPAPASELKLVPFADMAMEVAQIILYPKTDDESKYTKLLTAPVPLDRPQTFFFPMQSVAKFRVVLNQPIYNRMAQLVSVPEQNYSVLIKEVKSRVKVKFKVVRVRRLGWIQRIIIKKKKKGKWKKVYKGYGIAIPRLDFHPQWGPLRLDKIIQQFQRKVSHYDVWGKQEPFERTLLWLFGKHKFKDRHKVFFRTVKRYAEITVTTVDGSPPVTVAPIVISPPFVQAGFNYHYNLGLQHVAMGSSGPGFKGVFVSKPMPSPGDIGEVRIKTADNNYRLPSTDRHSSLLTSVEYSVSNQSEPSNESDWLPILPIGAGTLVEGERFFPDTAGRGYFRFDANIQGYLSLYRNGYRVNSGYTTIHNSARDAYSGLSLSVGTYTSDDIFTVDYVPASDRTTVNFEDAGFADIPLVAAHDETGAGEGFAATAGRFTVELASYPYIDYEQVFTSTYDDEHGLNPYQPIVVQLDTGEIATNLTNYKGEDQTSLPGPDAEGYYYIHSGNTLQFSRDIGQSFRVYYQYLQNNIRVKVVLRVNAKTFISPAVDFFHLKAKTRRADALEA